MVYTKTASAGKLYHMEPLGQISNAAHIVDRGVSKYLFIWNVKFWIYQLS